MHSKLFIIYTILLTFATTAHAQTSNLVELSNDSGVADAMLVLGNSYTSMATRFTPPDAATSVTLVSIRYFLSDTTQGSTGQLTIMSDSYNSTCEGDPQQHAPATELFVPVDFTAATIGWNEVDLSQMDLTFTHDFYGSLRSIKSSKLAIGIDSTAPRSLHTYLDDG